MTAPLHVIPGSTLISEPGVATDVPAVGQGEGLAAGTHSLTVGLDTNGDIRITAYGVPVTQGSKKAFVNKKTQQAIVVDDNKASLKPWRSAVHEAALHVMQLHDRLEGPVQVRLIFSFDRPTGHYRTGRNAHLLRDGAPVQPDNMKTGDIDKLARACLDALTTAGVYKDDSQVSDLRARKMWAGDEDALHIPGVIISIRPVTS